MQLAVYLDPQEFFQGLKICASPVCVDAIRAIQIEVEDGVPCCFSGVEFVPKEVVALVRGITQCVLRVVVGVHITAQHAVL